jgi:hypothetical protein
MCVLGQLTQLGRGVYLLVDELASPLRCLTLGIGLLSMGSSSLPLSKRLPSLKRELGVQPQREDPR